MAEWSKAHDWKSCVRHKRTMGSNPIFSATKKTGLCLFFSWEKWFINGIWRGRNLREQVVRLRKQITYEWIYSGLNCPVWQFIGAVCKTPNPIFSAKKYCRKGYVFCSIFLSKSQTWYIITARSVVDIISPLGCISSRISVYLSATWWYTKLRFDDMQFLTKLMIYKAFALILIRLCAIIY